MTCSLPNRLRVSVLILPLAFASTSRAEVYITTSSGYEVNRYRDDGTFVRKIDELFYEGIYDMTHAPDQSLITAAFVLGDLSLRRYDALADRIDGPNALIGYPLVTANAPIAVASNGDLLLGVNSFDSYNSGYPPSFPAHAIVRFNALTGTPSVFAAPPILGARLMYDLQTSPQGTLFGLLDNHSVWQFDRGGDGRLITTGAMQLAVDSVDGTLAILTATGDIVSIDPISGQSIRTLVPQALLGSGPIFNFVFGPSDSVLYSTRGAATNSLDVFKIDLADQSKRLFASTYSYGGEYGLVEYMAPEPTTLVSFAILGSVLRRQTRGRRW